MFKRKKKKTGVQMPEFRKPTAPPPPPTSGSNAVKPNPNYVPPASNPHPYTPPPIPSIKPAKQKENKIMNKTMYGLNLYIPFEELDAYIHDHIEDIYKDHTFIPVNVKVNEVTLDVEISLVSAVPIECDKRYKLDLNKLPKENTK